MGHNTIVEDNIDILVCGAGLGGTGAAFEARYWGQDKKIVIAEKANIDRSPTVFHRDRVKKNRTHRIISGFTTK